MKRLIIVYVDYYGLLIGNIKVFIIEQKVSIITKKEIEFLVLNCVILKHYLYNIIIIKSVRWKTLGNWEKLIPCFKV